MINWIQQTLLRHKKTDKGRMTLEKLKEEYRNSDVCMGKCCFPCLPTGFR